MNKFFLVSILILLDYLFLSGSTLTQGEAQKRLNPYFTGLSILIPGEVEYFMLSFRPSQSLFYWIIYSYYSRDCVYVKGSGRLNPYFTGLSILIM